MSFFSGPGVGVSPGAGVGGVCVGGAGTDLSGPGAGVRLGAGVGGVAGSALGTGGGDVGSSAFLQPAAVIKAKIITKIAMTPYVLIDMTSLSDCCF
ncbi:MAG: hypothetical protein ACOYW7_12520 [Nitrospirota bacterium]